jgi:hypothetical protein
MDRSIGCGVRLVAEEDCQVAAGATDRVRNESGAASKVVSLDGKGGYFGRRRPTGMSGQAGTGADWD